MNRSLGPPAILAGAIGAVLILGGLGYAAETQGYVADRTLVVLTALGYGTLGGWVWARAVPVIGIRMIWVGLAAALNWAAQEWSGSIVGSWASQWTWFAPVLLVPLILTRFADGRLQPGPARVLEPTLAVCAAAVTGLLAIAAAGAPRTLVADPGVASPGWSRLLVKVALVMSAVWLLAALSQLVVLVVASMRRTGAARGQLLALGVALLATLGGMVGLVFQDAFAFQVVVALALPVGLGAAVLRYSLYDLDLLVHRFGVWVVLTATLLAATIGVMWLITGVTVGHWTRGVAVAVLTVLVLALDPIRRAAQRGVDRLLFGRRGAPAEALASLGRGLGSATAQQSREQLCRSVAETLALPWVGLSRAGELVAAWGRRTSAPLEVPLAHGSVALLLAPRRSGERFGEADLKVVRAMTGQIEVAMRAMDAADELQQARERLVRSREEERKRLRNDLHDGVGPALAGIRMQVTALARHDADRWHQVDADLEACTAEISRVIEGLRPPILDDGLVPALERETTRWSGSSTEVRVARADLDGRPLPAAVEIAAYRIIAEAVSNAVRHANACMVTIELSGENGDNGGELAVQVRDNGSGKVAPREAGVGLTSMRDRAEELGGSLSIIAIPERGTTITAVLPIGRLGRAQIGSETSSVVPRHAGQAAGVDEAEVGE